MAQYRQSGDTIVQRTMEKPVPPQEYLDQLKLYNEWHEVPEADYLDAMVQVEVANRMRIFNKSRIGKPISVVITRSPQNEEIAAKWGITADEMAERLTKPDDNRGTRLRVSDDEFDHDCERMNLTGDEARRRFKGTHWTESE